MTRRTSLLGSAAVYSISNILNGALPFLLLPVMARLLPPQEYGVLAMFTVLLGIMGAFVGLSVQGAVNSRYMDRDSIDFPNYVGASLWVLCLSTIVTTILVVILQVPLSKLTAMPPLWIFVSIAGAFSGFVVQIRLGIWLMAKKPVQYGLLQVGMSIVNVSLSLILVIWVSRNASGRMSAQTLATVIAGVIAFGSLLKDGWVDIRFNKKYIKEIFNFGFPLIPHVVGSFLLASADRLVVNERLGLHDAGIYMVAAQLGVGMAMAADAFNKAFVPWLYEKLKSGGDRDKRAIVSGTWIYFGAALVIAGGMALLSPWIISLCAGPRYHDATGALRWIALGQAFGGMYLMVTNYVFYVRKTAFLGWFTLTSGVIGVGASWLLVPMMGVAGAGAGLAIGMLAKFLLTWWLAHRVYPMPWLSNIRRFTTAGG